MAQSGYTPIQLYRTTTAAASPSTANLSDGELAINITDGKLFYKDNTGALQTIATKAAVTNVSSLSFGSTGLTPSTATTGVVSVAGTLVVGNGGSGVTTITGIIKGSGTSAFSAATAGTDYGAPATASTWSASQRGTVTTDNDGSFDMNVTNNFSCTPTGTITLTFTNITAGQSGYILLVNGSNYTVAAAATTKVATGVLTALSVTGTYLVSYFSNGTNVYLTASGALA